MEGAYRKPDGVHDLCASIVRQAVMDYDTVLHKMAMYGEISGTDGKKRRYKAAMYQEILSLQEFFRSGWFERICDLDGQTIQKKVEERVKQELWQKLQDVQKRKTKAQKKTDAAGADPNQMEM